MELIHLLQETDEQEKNEIMACQKRISQCNLTLTKQDIEGLIITRKQVLRDVGRVEFHSTIIEQIIEEFCDSLFINPYNYVDSLYRIIEIFYYYKDATEDYLTDEEIIHYLKLAFDGVCQGSFDELSERQLDILCYHLMYKEDIYEDIEYGYYS